MKKPLFSLVIPVFNVENYLRNCLESAINQDFDDYEIIIVNDASEDNSQAIILEYLQSNPGINHIKLEKNVGLGYARNIGLEHAQGEYVFFLDSDDWIDLNTFSILEKIIAQHIEPRVDMVLFNHKQILDGVEYNNLSDTVYQSNSCESTFLKDKSILFKVFHVAWNKLYRVEFLKDNKLTYPQGAYEDISVTHRCYALTDNIILTRQSLYFYRLRQGTKLGGAISKGHKNDHFIVFDRYDEIFDLLDQQPNMLEFRANTYKHMLKQLTTILVSGTRIEKPKQAAFIQQSANAIDNYFSDDFSLPLMPFKFIIFLIKHDQVWALKWLMKSRYFFNKQRLKPR